MENNLKSILTALAQLIIEADHTDVNYVTALKNARESLESAQYSQQEKKPPSNNRQFRDGCKKCGGRGEAACGYCDYSGTPGDR